ncbi:hypothetical protein DOK67_0000149 [Enterococcus sp. DIV0212c]|uniref:hypothetical protein n=1 Tax=Enterococcus sp. DIV0212c TaxID=2230867 RepID=UPI001A9B545C|nr:hypothetical protein [Enterococcus sp. DIV0212c]MBO1353997.1 hypothetical protein [Enterococcus sp. DIV0212c]
MDILITSIISILTIVTSAYITQNTNKKTIRANIQTKTNIEWIDQIRKISAELIYNYELIISSAKFSYGNKVAIAVNEAEIENQINTALNSGILNGYPQAQKEALLKSKKGHDETYNESVATASLLTNQLLLYFIDEKKDAYIVEMIMGLRSVNSRIADFSRIQVEVGEDMSYYHEKTDEFLSISGELDSAINEFRNAIASYLKVEWENVKKENR